MIRLWYRSSRPSLLCTFFVVVGFVIFPFSRLQAEEAKPKSLIELTMDAQQSEKVLPDLPSKALVVDNFENVWFLGTHFLWKWNPSRRTVEQIKLVTEKPLKQMVISGDHIFVSDDDQLFQVQIEPFKVLSFPSSDKESLSLGLLDDQTKLYWVKSDGVYEMAKEGAALKKILTHALSEFEDSKYLYIPETKTLWMTKNQELSYLSYSESGKPKKFGKIEKNIHDIQKINEDVFALSQHAVFRFTKRGRLIQTVPVAPQRRIVLSSLVPNAHAYVFQDRLLEVHFPADKKTFHFYLNVGRVHKATTMFFRNSYLGLVLDGAPRIFQFSNTDWEF